MFDHFIMLYRDRRWNRLRLPGMVPAKDCGTRVNPLSAFLFAAKYTIRDIWRNLIGARRRKMQQEEKELFAMELSPRFTYGKRMVNDSVGVNFKCAAPMSKQEADQVLKESRRTK